MLEGVVSELLGVLGARAERLSWWAYDRASRLRLERGRRQAASAWSPQPKLSIYMPRLAPIQAAPPVETDAAPPPPAPALEPAAPVMRKAILAELVPAFEERMRAAG